MFLKDKIMKEIEENDQAIPIVMASLGEDSYLTDTKGNLMFRTICHDGESKKLYYMSDSKCFHCYTDCACNYSVFDLVMKVKEIGFSASQGYVANVLGIKRSFKFDGFKDESADEDWNMINRFKKYSSKAEKLENPKPIKFKTYNKNILYAYPNLYHISWIEEGISIEAMDKFMIRFDTLDNKIIIPHFDIDGNLIGIRGRALNEYDITSGYKYMPVKLSNDWYNHDTGHNLYGLHKTKEAIQKQKKIVIFEAEKSVLKSESFYGVNNFSVATGGGAISKVQRNIILSLGVEEVIIAYDRENYIDPKTPLEIKTNKKYVDKLLKLALMFSPYVKTYVVFDDIGVLDWKDSPIDKGKAVLEQLMKSKVEILTKESKESKEGENKK